MKVLKHGLTGTSVSKFVRDLRGEFGMYWCDRCRVFTDNPEAHLHAEKGVN